ncbi:MAG: hypothetical protein AAGE94_07540 [Acidobacteriota bacterium]
MARTTPRWLIEALVLLILGAIGYGLWWWQGVQHRSELVEQTQTLRESFEAKQREVAQRLHAAAANEATAVATAFAAGIRPLVAEDRTEDIDAAVLSILELPGVQFVHLLDRDGVVLVSSDRKMLTTGQAGPRATWALDTEGAVQRVAEGGVIEIAVPLPRSEGAGDAILWIGHDPGTD